MTSDKIAEGPERRHGARIDSEFWITDLGGDEEPLCMSGNVSVSGLYLFTEKSMGDAGTVLQLKIATYDQDEEVEVVVHVVREVRISDMYRGDRLAGVALGFLFRGEPQRHDMEQFVFQVALLQGDRKGNLESQPSFEAKVDGPGDGAGLRGAVVRALSPDRMMMEADWSMEVGESIQVEVRLPASRKKVAFTGTVSSCNEFTRPDGKVLYEVLVSFNQITHDTDLYSAAAVRQALEGDPSPVPAANADPFRSMLGARLQAPTAKERSVVSIYHLRGTLAQMGLTSLLSFLDLERRTGVCTLYIRKRVIRLFLRHGRLIDVERDGRPADPYVLLPGLLELDQGEFEIAFRPVARKDRLGVSTTALLLEIAQRRDESNG